MPKPDPIGIPTPTDLPSALNAIRLLTEAIRQMQDTLTGQSKSLEQLTKKVG